jgi:hypothetical protein
VRAMRRVSCMYSSPAWLRLRLGRVQSSGYKQWGRFGEGEAIVGARQTSIDSVALSLSVKLRPSQTSHSRPSDRHQTERRRQNDHARRFRLAAYTLPIGGLAVAPLLTLLHSPKENRSIFGNKTHSLLHGSRSAGPRFSPPWCLMLLRLPPDAGRLDGLMHNFHWS